MSTVTRVWGSAWNFSQVHLPASDLPSCRARVHLSSGVRGVGPALRTGKPSVTYWPGGIRSAATLARGRPVKPLVMGAPSAGLRAARRPATIVDGISAAASQSIERPYGGEPPVLSN